MLPGEEKTLHLFEARYLALFDEAILNYDRRFGHILLSTERSSLAASGALVHISEWERMDVGVKLRIHGIGRIQVSSVELGSAAPYILGSVAFVRDSLGDENDGDVPLSHVLALEESFWKEALRLIDVSVELGIPPFRSKKHVAPATMADDNFGATSNPPPPDDMDPAAKKVGLEVVLTMLSFMRKVDVDVFKMRAPSVQPTRTTRLLANTFSFLLSRFHRIQVVYMQQLREAVARASWPVTGSGGVEDGESTLDEDEKTLCRLRAVSFAGFDLFSCDAGVRQRALEVNSTAKRLLTVLNSTRARLKMLDAQLALRRAFPSMPGEF